MAKPLAKIEKSHLSAGILLCCGFLSQALGAQAGNSQPAALSGVAVDHMTISVKNLDGESEWYEKVLGFNLARRSDTNPDFRTMQLRIPGFRIDLIQYKGSTRPDPVQPLYMHQGWIHLAFNVPDLSAALIALRALNTDVKVDNKDANGAPTRLVVHDPEGNEIEIFGRQSS